MTDTGTKFAFRLDWNLLRVFLVIVQEQSISRAADRLLRGQPAVSLALQRLEEALDCRLIERGKGGFRLTAAGTRLYAEVETLFQGVSHLPDTISDGESELSGEVRLSLASHVVTPLLDRALTKFSTTYPKVRFVMRVDASQNVVQAVRDRHATLGLCLLTRKPRDLEYDLMYREFFGFYCGKPHPLFGRKGLEMEDLRDYPFVAFDTEERDNALQELVRLRSAYGLTHDVVGRSSQLEEVRRMVACGMGLGALPLHVVKDDVARGVLWRLPPYDTPPQVDVFMVTSSSKHQSRAEQAFVAELRQMIATTPLLDRTYGD